MRSARLAAGLLLPALMLAGCATGTSQGDQPAAPGDSGTSTTAPSTDDQSSPPPGDSSGGSDGDAAGGTRPSGSPSPTGLPADLTITVDASGSGATQTWTLTCDPPGGDHPDPAWACEALEQAGGVAAFDPVPRTAVCTEIYGGPQTAHVEGTVDGTPVNADFSRTNGCEINRWDALRAVLGDVAGA
jgi:hypothetical protein